MFKENDKFLKTASTLLAVSVFLMVVVGIILFLVFAIDKQFMRGVIIMSAICFGAYLSWVFGNLLLSFFCDVKLIRNKLYDNNNTDLDLFK